MPPSDKNVSEERKDSGSEIEIESSSSDKDQEQNSEDEGLRFANRREIASDHRFYDQTRYEALYSWLYYNHSLNGYMCKLCEVFCAGMSCSTGSHRGAWSHKGVNFKDNAGKKLRRHSKSVRHS